MFLIPKKIIGLDFHDYYAQVVELKSYGKNVELLAFNRLAIPPNIIRDGDILNKEELKSIIGALLNTANPKAIKGKNVVCSFPSKKIFTHIFKFPAVLTEKEVEKAIPFEAEMIIPFSIQDIYWDFKILSKDDSKTKHASQYILFAGVQKNVADTYVSLLNSLGLTPFAFTIPAECVEFALRSQLSRVSSSLVIDVGSLVTTYSLFEGANLKDVSTSLESGRSLAADLAKKMQISEAEIISQKEKNNFNSALLPDIANFENKIFCEAKNFIGTHNVKTVFITGEFLNLPNFYDLAKKAFPNKEISFGDPRIGVNIDSNKFIPLDKKEGFIPYSIYFTGAFGLALKGLNPKFDGINLLPDNLRASFASKKLSFALGTASIVFAAISLVVCTTVVFKHQELSFARGETEAERNSVQQLIYGTRYQEIKKAISDFNTEVGDLVNIQKSLFSVPSLLDDIFSSIPTDVTVSSLEFTDKDLTVNISGVANTREALLGIQKKFEGSSYIEKVIAPLSNFDEKSNISFVLKLKLKFNDLKPYGFNGREK